MDFSFSFKKPPKGSSQPPARNPFEAAEEQFNAIRGCGVTPRPRVTFAQLMDGQDPAAFEAAPFAAMLGVMAGADSAGEPMSDDVLIFNPQCITHEGAYTLALTQFVRLCKGAIPLENISDTFDAEHQVATISATLDAEPVELAVSCEDGAFAPDVLSFIASAAADRGSGSRLAWADHEGSKLVVFLTEQEVGELASATSMEWSIIQ